MAVTVKVQESWVSSAATAAEMAAESIDAPAGGVAAVFGPGVAGWNGGWMMAPIVVRVHVRDARAAACAPSIRVQCEQAIVVESVVWRGP